jgi:hypothetical protein
MQFNDVALEAILRNPFPPQFRIYGSGFVGPPLKGGAPHSRFHCGSIPLPDRKAGAGDSPAASRLTVVAAHTKIPHIDRYRAESANSLSPFKASKPMEA